MKKKNIKPSNYPCNGKSEKLESESESEFEETIPERTKSKRQKSD